MLTTGVVPALFETDERDALASSVRDQVKAAGLVETNESCWRFYVNLCRQNLHVILAMSPSGSTLRTRCRNFPGLVSATVIDWFFAWPEDALRNVAQYFLAEEAIPEESREQVTNHLVHAHLRVVRVAHQFGEELRRHYYVTPKNYLDFISNYRLQLKENKVKVTASIARLKGGLTKLVEAAQAVDVLQIELSEKKIIVDEKTLACEALIKTIEEKSTVASKQQEVAAATQIECEKASVLIAREKEEADAALLEALPAVEAAAAALQDLSKADLTELKSFASPPPLVMSVCMCVLILKPTGQELDLDWKGAKVMLSNANLITLLKEYEKDKISSKMITKIKTFFKNPDLNIENMKSISRAGAGLLVWVVAIVKYHDVAKNVEPLRLKVKTMEKEQTIKEQELADLKATLDRLKTELDNLSTQFQEANSELQGLKTQADQMQKRLQAASKLLAGLGSERTRWTKDVDSLNLQSERLVGDCLLTASFLSYAGAFSFDYRSDLIYRDFFLDIGSRNLPVTTPFRLESSLTDDATIQKWVSEGLPADEHSVQNDETKNKATEISAKLELASFTKDEITKAREVYTPVALRGSIMYFAMAALATIMKMYEISLASFLTVFHTALETAKRDVVLEKRLRFMVQSITEMMYDYTCTGIFERHKLMFSFQMTCMILSASGDLNRAELDFFLKGDTSLDAASQPKPEDITWVSGAGWKDLLCLSRLGEAEGSSVFGSLMSDFANKTSEWKAWYDLEAPELADLPCGYSDKLSSLQKLLVFRCFRQDRVYNAMKLFVMAVMGEKFVQPPVLDYARIYSQSAATAPIRRKYGKIGWNVSYDFNESDFTISRKLLSLYLYKAYEDHDEQLPWGSLKYLIGDAMYGGRVSDDYDRRILTTYLSEYMGDFLFDDCQRFYFSRSGFDYVLPGALDGNSSPLALELGDYVATVETLPLTNSPAVFGLHPNAEIGYYTNMSKSVWKDLISLQPRSAQSGAGVSREDHIGNVASDIQSKVPEPVDVDQIRKRLGLTPIPTQVVLLQELDRWNLLTARMRVSLGDLQKALVGEIGMSDELDAVGNALYDGFLPNLWRALCPKTEKPLGSWMEHFTQRFKQYMDWVANGDPRVMWLSGLGIPESYLTALVQATCRAKNWPLDKSTLYTRVTSFTQDSQLPAIDGTKDDTGCYVKGLFLEGASWDLERGCLAPQRPKQLVEELPILQVIPIEASRLKLQNTFRTPVYVTQSRRNAMGVGLVFEADLYSTEHASHWVLQGVALALNTDY
ncbi:Dynein heavy chain 10, axonemal [Phytophthora fragariae]|uniref:Dynein heavy chain 10, axonemal n=1 Tax=Phytophthora fragariae TaxID=53985 RepID=A0A6G0NFH3_9STRA|nr:Dynein heavy chain 10, axonemal [Phytophthora fragariae]